MEKVKFLNKKYQKEKENFNCFLKKILKKI